MAEPLRALMAEVDREGHVDGATPRDLAGVSAVQRATRPLAKPVQIARGLIAAFASTATVTGGQGARGAA